jgi:hypothetical protein
MALISPGVEIKVFDDSAYAPAGTGTVPLLMIATDQDKNNITNDDIAAGTTKVNAGKLAIIGSQRELAALYGAPFFEQTSSGTPVHGGERNEYGLMAAYSLLGITNRVMTVRADIDLKQLRGTTVRPTGKPVDGIYWLDTTSTVWGLFVWNAGTQSFSTVTPTVITTVANVNASTLVPLPAYGSVGDYTVVAIGNMDQVVYYKSRASVWVVVGSTAWQAAIPTVVGTVSNTAIGAGALVINGVTVTVAATTTGGAASTLDDLAAGINALTATTLTGVSAAVVNGFLEIYATSAATAGQLVVTSATFTVGSATGLPAIGLTAGTFQIPATKFSSHTITPRWRIGDPVNTTTGTGPRPNGSIWVKVNAINLGANLVLSKYNLSLNVFNQIATPLYADDQTANANLDASGGKLIPVGNIYAQYNVDNDGTVRYRLYRRNKTAPTVLTSNSVGTLTAAATFTIRVSSGGNANLTAAVTIVIPAAVAPATAPTLAQVVNAINATGIPNLTAVATASNELELTHALGGVIVLAGTTTLTSLGITATTSGVRAGPGSTFIVSNWEPLSNSNYASNNVKPSQAPEDGTLWFYNSISDVDIMIHDGSATKNAWKGYRTIGASGDARGFNLSLTDPNGVIVSASMPISQSNGTTALALGDLWLDTSDLENYPKLHRWESVSGVNRWVQIDNSDQTSENGILFADARWDTDGTSETITGALTPTRTLLTNSYLDFDAPDATAYPRGTLLFNTRRSGFNVKKYQLDYFNASNFVVNVWSGTAAYAAGDRVVFTNGKIYSAKAVITVPATPGTTNPAPPLTPASWAELESSPWVTAAGNRINGSPYMGNRAVRALVVRAMKAAIDTNTSIREEGTDFTLIATPGYPELIPNMVSLNNDRRNTAFVIGDTSMRLPPVSTELQNWSKGISSGNMYDEAIRVSDSYLAVYYPSALYNDLTGNTIAVPPSHMVLRTVVRSDSLSFPWFAPAGTQRGLVDNASSLGYVNARTGEFVTFGMSEGIRDTLYETKINPITFLPGTGIVVYGQKTRSPASTALDRINVARLISYLREVINRLARPFIFEPNDKITRDQIKQIIEQMLNGLMAQRALYDYLVVCDSTNNTPSRIDRNELYVDVAIEPVKAVEFIYIPLRIKNTGEIASNF